MSAPRRTSEMISDAKLDLVALEIDETERARKLGDMACELHVPGKRHPPLLGQRRVKGRTGKQRALREPVETEAVIEVIPAKPAAEKYPWLHLRRNRGRDSELGLPHPLIQGDDAGRLGVVENVDRGIELLRYQF